MADAINPQLAAGLVVRGMNNAAGSNFLTTAEYRRAQPNEFLFWAELDENGKQEKAGVEQWIVGCETGEEYTICIPYDSEVIEYERTH